MRLIDADALMQKAVVTFYTTNYFSHITKMIDDAPTVKPEETQWIPVTERFPKEGNPYLIYHESFGIRIDTRVNGEWKTYGDDTVLAWMPLPEPYAHD